MVLFFSSSSPCTLITALYFGGARNEFLIKPTYEHVVARSKRSYFFAKTTRRRGKTRDRGFGSRINWKYPWLTSNVSMEMAKLRWIMNLRTSYTYSSFPLQLYTYVIRDVEKEITIWNTTIRETNHRPTYTPKIIYCQWYHIRVAERSPNLFAEIESCKSGCKKRVIWWARDSLYRSVANWVPRNRVRLYF